jgi:hypothetical protein
MPKLDPLHWTMKVPTPELFRLMRLAEELGLPHETLFQAYRWARELGLPIEALTPVTRSN